MLVQIDAHTDLRDTFDGTPYSHACAMRRCLPYVSKMLQIGIRCLCQEEVDFLRGTDQVQVWTAEALHRDTQRGYLQALAQAVAGKNVYLTIDLDGLDPSIMPAVGTPEPGGIGWYDCLDILQTVVTNSHVVAMDCVELAPTLGSQGSNFSAARLVYRTLNYIMLERGKLKAPASIYGL
jgi:agmatinase